MSATPIRSRTSTPVRRVDDDSARRRPISASRRALPSSEGGPNSAPLSPPSSASSFLETTLASLNQLHVELASLTLNLAPRVSGVASRHGEQLASIRAAAKRLKTDAQALISVASEGHDELESGGAGSREDGAMRAREVDRHSRRREGDSAAPLNRRDAAATPPPSTQEAIVDIAERYGLAVSRLRAMNPHLRRFRDEDLLPVNTVVYLRPKDSLDPTTSEGGLSQDDGDQPNHERSRRVVRRTTQQRPRYQEDPPLDYVTGSETDGDGGQLRPKSLLRSSAKGPVRRPAATDLSPIASSSSSKYDTLRSVAKRFGVSVSDIMDANSGRFDDFHADDWLPPGLLVVIPSRRWDDVCITVRGDTLRLIASDYNLDVRALTERNPSIFADFGRDEAIVPEGTAVVLPPGAVMGDDATSPPPASHASSRRTDSGKDVPRPSTPTRSSAVSDHTPRPRSPRQQHSPVGAAPSASSPPLAYTPQASRGGTSSSRLVALPVTRTLAEVAADHRCTVETLVALNSDRKALVPVPVATSTRQSSSGSLSPPPPVLMEASFKDIAPGDRLPEGTVVRVPRANN
mgnify:CR=1 FL=1